MSDIRTEERTITLPALTAEQRRIIALEYRDEQRLKFASSVAEQRVEPEKQYERLLCLLCFSKNTIALPDEKGRAVNHGALYAWVYYDEDGIPLCFSRDVEIVATGDGRPLDQSVYAQLPGTGLVSIVKIKENIRSLVTEGARGAAA